MPAPVSLIPPRPGDGSGICEPREKEYRKPERKEPVAHCVICGDRYNGRFPDSRCPTCAHEHKIEPPNARDNDD